MNCPAIIPATFLLLAGACLSATPAGRPVTLADRYTLFTPAQAQLDRARAEASRRIDGVPECRAEFEKLSNWRHKPVHIFLTPIPVSRTSPWIAKTLCFKDGSAHILIKEDFVNWTLLKDKLGHVVNVVVHELVHVNHCPDSFVGSEPEAQRIEAACSLPNLHVAQVGE